MQFAFQAQTFASTVAWTADCSARERNYAGSLIPPNAVRIITAALDETEASSFVKQLMIKDSPENRRRCQLNH